MSREAAMTAMTTLFNQPSEVAANSTPAAGKETVPNGTHKEEGPSHEQKELVASEVPSEDASSKAFSQLAKKEAELVRQRQELAGEKEKVTPILKKAEEFEALRKTDPVAALKMLGFNETEIFNFLAGQQPKELTAEEKVVQAAEKATDAKIKAFEESEAKKAADKQKQADDAAVKVYRDNIAKAISDNAEKFEYCAFHGDAAKDLIYETVLEIVRKSEGKDVPTPEEAAQMVEEYYEHKDEEMSKLKKRQIKEIPKLEPVSGSKLESEVAQKPSIPRPPSRMLTNAATTTAGSLKPMNETPSQKRERLAAMLRNG